MLVVYIQISCRQKAEVSEPMQAAQEGHILKYDQTLLNVL